MKDYLSQESLVWVRVGDYRTFPPYKIHKTISHTISDPIVLICLHRYLDYLKKHNIQIKEPIQVIIQTYDHKEKTEINKAAPIKNITLEFKIDELKPSKK